MLMVERWRGNQSSGECRNRRTVDGGAERRHDDRRSRERSAFVLDSRRRGLRRHVLDGDGAAAGKHRADRAVVNVAIAARLLATVDAARGSGDTDGRQRHQERQHQDGGARDVTASHLRASVALLVLRGEPGPDALAEVGACRRPVAAGEDPLLHAAARRARPRSDRSVPTSPASPSPAGSWRAAAGRRRACRRRRARSRSVAPVHLEHRHRRRRRARRRRPTADADDGRDLVRVLAGDALREEAAVRESDEDTPASDRPRAASPGRR